MRLSLGKIKGGGSTCFEVKLHILLAQGINNCRPFMRLSWKNFYLIYKYWKYYRTLLSTNWFFFICESFLAKTWMFQSRVCYQRNIIWDMQYILDAQYLSRERSWKIGVLKKAFLWFSCFAFVAKELEEVMLVKLQSRILTASAEQLLAEYIWVVQWHETIWYYSRI